MRGMRSCRDVAHLVLEAGDRRLRWRERAAVRLHMWICKACPRFEDQVNLMRRATARWRTYREGDGDGAP